MRHSMNGSVKKMQGCRPLWLRLQRLHRHRHKRVSTMLWFWKEGFKVPGFLDDTPQMLRNSRGHEEQAIAYGRAGVFNLHSCSSSRINMHENHITGINEVRLATSDSQQQPILIAGYQANIAKQVVQLVVAIPQKKFRQVTRRPQKCSVSIIVQLSM